MLLFSIDLHVTILEWGGAETTMCEAIHKVKNLQDTGGYTFKLITLVVQEKAPPTDEESRKLMEDRLSRCNHSHCPFYYNLLSYTLFSYNLFPYLSSYNLVFYICFSYNLFSPLTHLSTGDLPSFVTRCNHSHCLFFSRITSYFLV